MVPEAPCCTTGLRQMRLGHSSASELYTPCEGPASVSTSQARPMCLSSQPVLPSATAAKQRAPRRDSRKAALGSVEGLAHNIWLIKGLLPSGWAANRFKHG